jgi:hypothetical protein
MDPATGGVVVTTVVTFGVGFAICLAFGCVVGAFARYLYLRERDEPVTAPGT